MSGKIATKAYNLLKVSTIKGRGHTYVDASGSGVKSQKCVSPILGKP